VPRGSNHGSTSEQLKAVRKRNFEKRLSDVGLALLRCEFRSNCPTNGTGVWGTNPMSGKFDVMEVYS
jgi:hypothetical protein